MGDYERTRHIDPTLVMDTKMSDKEVRNISSLAKIHEQKRHSMIHGQKHIHGPPCNDNNVRGLSTAPNYTWVFKREKCPPLDQQILIG